VSQKNKPTLASCSFNKNVLILVILNEQHQHTFKNYMHMQLSLSLHFCLLNLLLQSCDGKDAKYNTFFSKKAAFNLADVQSDVFSPSPMHVTTFSIDQQLH